VYGAVQVIVVFGGSGFGEQVCKTLLIEIQLTLSAFTSPGLPHPNPPDGKEKV
jgi:hypothetical protein